MSKSIKKVKFKNLKIILVCFLTFIYYLLTFFTDKMMIDFSNFSLKNYIIIKIIAFLIILFFGMCLYKIFVAEDENYRKYFKYFLIYFIPVFIILILIWPGVQYGYDQIDLIKMSETVTFGTWLNYLTSVFYSLGLTLFPATAGGGGHRFTVNINEYNSWIYSKKFNGYI